VLVNRPWQNVVNWSMIVLLFGLSAILAAQTIAPNLFPKGGS
jgi:Mn2+/Fe2+ NRAMP family transporter